jgi:ArsR family transcriptional regulator, arsenate/arsenite/antimonite-responsive transcriptional repressor
VLLMQIPAAVEALSALAHTHRLAVFRLLVKAGADGVPAGGIAREVGVLANTLSTHLAILGHAGLIQSRREGRSVIYSANYDGMRALMDFLIADCCGGRPEICAPLAEMAQAADCCER